MTFISNKHKMHVTLTLQFNCITLSKYHSVNCIIYYILRRKMSDVVLKFIKSGRGTVLLCEGYRFHKHVHYKNGNSLWRCEHYKKSKLNCPGSVSLNSVRDYFSVNRIVPARFVPSIPHLCSWKKMDKKFHLSHLHILYFHLCTLLPTFIVLEPIYYKTQSSLQSLWT